MGPFLSVDARRRLGAVARGERPADLFLRGASLLNVFTGEIYPANVAIAGERIAYVGTREECLGTRTRVLDLSGRVLVPGYIDPHVHPANLVTPAAFARHVLALGTTTVVADSLQFCFDICTQGTRLQDAVLEIVDIPGAGNCRSCGAVVDLGASWQACECGSLDLEIVRGEELRLVQVEVI